MYYSSSSLILSPSSQTKHVTSSLFPGASGQLPPTVHTSPVSVASGSSLFSPHHTPTLHLLFLVPTVCPLLLNTHLSRLAFPQALHSIHHLNHSGVLLALSVQSLPQFSLHKLRYMLTNIHSHFCHINLIKENVD